MPSLELKQWGVKVGADEPLLCLLGLNVLEDEALALETATELKQICARLRLPFVFKASFDKANRSSIKSYRGPGMGPGLAILEKVKSELNIPVVTDIHDPNQAEAAAKVADILQIPAFLCRQTDLITAAVQELERTKGWLHIKKGQFLAPWDCQNILDKTREVATGEAPPVLFCERGTSFGYNNLIVDMLAISELQKLGTPVTLDATHAVQLPGAGRGDGKGEAGSNTTTGGRRDGISILAQAGVAAGVDGIFLEFHPDPDKARCDGPSCLPLTAAEPLLKKLSSIRACLR